MTRNIDKYTKAGKEIVTAGRSASLTGAEMEHFISVASDKSNPDALIDAILSAFYFGAAVGEKKSKQ